MRLWMWPKYNDTNMYNRMLSESLEECGVEVLEFKTRYFPRVRKGEILHMHWIHGMYQSDFKIFFIMRSMIMLFLMSMMKIRGVKLIWTLHNIYPHKMKFIFLERIIRNMVIKLCNRVIVASNSVKDEVLKEYRLDEPKIRIIPHGHYKGIYQQNNYNVRMRMGIPSDQYVFLFLGSIKPYKGIQLLIKAFNELKDPMCCLLIVGKPTTEMKEMLEKAKLKNNQIKLDLRFIPDEEIYDTLDSANVLVLPYEEITTSGSAILALSYYKPIIAPMAPFLMESFNEHTSILYDSKDPLSLEKALIKAKTINFERNKPYFDEKLNEISWGLIAENLCKIYKSI
jgi:beta-1,4-mannosyltransferase